MLRFFVRRLLAFAAAFMLTTLTLLNGEAALAQSKYRTVEELRDDVMARIKTSDRVKELSIDPKDSATFNVTIVDRSGEELQASVFVGNLFDRLNVLGSKDPENDVQRFVSAMLELGDPPPFDPEKVYANVRHKSVVDALEASAGKPDEPDKRPLFEPLAGDIIILFQQDHPDSMSSLTAEDIKGSSLEEIKTLARQNIARELSHLKEEKLAPDASLFWIDGNPSLTPAILLADEFWEKLALSFPEGVLVAAPRRDQVFVFDKRSPDAAAKARKMIEATKEDGVDLLSDLVFERQGGKLQVHAEK